jgi:hypothetical protein
MTDSEQSIPEDLAMLRYLVGWFTIRTDRELPNLYTPNEPLFCAAWDAGFLVWSVSFYDLTDAGVQWIRDHLLADGFASATCESCSVIVTTRIPDGTGERPSCIACEVGRQRSIAVLLAAAEPEPEPAAGIQLELLG